MFALSIFIYLYYDFKGIFLLLSENIKLVNNKKKFEKFSKFI